MKHRLRWENKNFDDMGTLTIVLNNQGTHDAKNETWHGSGGIRTHASKETGA